MSISEALPPPETTDEPSQEAERLNFAVAVLLIAAALFTAYLGVTVSGINYGAPLINAIMTDVNRSQAVVNGEARARQNYTIYSYYRINDALADAYAGDITDYEDPAQQSLVRRLDETTYLAENNRFFFPGRYLTADGSYDYRRDVNEYVSQIERKTEIDPEPYYTEVNEAITLKQDHLLVFFLMGLSMGALALVELIYWRRRLTRYAFALVGTGLFAYSIFLVLQIREVI